MANFEVVSKFKDAGLELPKRATKYSAGYDLRAAENITIPPLEKLIWAMKTEWDSDPIAAPELTLAQMASLTKSADARPTLVSTGLKVHLGTDEYLELAVRSSTPYKHWLILANSEGIIDADYYNNPDNEGEIFLQLVNLSPIPIHICKGDCIGQGIIKNYKVTDDEAFDETRATRMGGLGSTN